MKNFAISQYISYKDLEFVMTKKKTEYLVQSKNSLQFLT